MSSSPGPLDCAGDSKAKMLSLYFLSQSGHSKAPGDPHHLVQGTQVSLEKRSGCLSHRFSMKVSLSVCVTRVSLASASSHGELQQDGAIPWRTKVQQGRQPWPKSSSLSQDTLWWQQGPSIPRQHISDLSAGRCRCQVQSHNCQLTKSAFLSLLENLRWKNNQCIPSDFNQQDLAVLNYSQDN